MKRIRSFFYLHGIIMPHGLQGGRTKHLLQLSGLFRVQKRQYCTATQRGLEQFGSLYDHPPRPRPFPVHRRKRTHHSGQCHCHCRQLFHSNGYRRFYCRPAQHPRTGQHDFSPRLLRFGLPQLLFRLQYIPRPATERRRLCRMRILRSDLQPEQSGTNQYR